MARSAPMAALLVFLLGAWGVFSFPAHHDASWLLYVAGRLLDGARLYHDVVEINPPLIVWFTALPALVARLTGAWDMLVFRGLVLLLAGASLLVSARHLRVLAPGIAAVLLPLLAWLLVGFAGLEFGQREHLALLLVLPYALLGARVVQGEDQGVGRLERFATGAAAALGFSLKPHFLPAWLAYEAVLALRTRGRSLARPAHLALLVTGALYALLVLLFAREYLRILPLAVPTYSAFARAGTGALLLAGPAWVCYAVLAAWLGLRRHTRLRAGGDALAALGFAFLLTVWLQGKGWSYHWLPALVVLLVLAAWLALDLLRAERRPRVMAAALLVAVLLPAVFGVRLFGAAERQWERMRGGFYRLPALLHAVESHGGGGPVAAFSIYMQTAFPLLSYTDAEWALRFNGMWFLPGFYPPAPPRERFPYHRPAAMGEAEAYFFEGVVEDLVRTRPKLLIVDARGPSAALPGFDYLEYFAQDPRVAALFREYRELPPVGYYRLLERR